MSFIKLIERVAELMNRNFVQTVAFNLTIYVCVCAYISEISGFCVRKIYIILLMTSEIGFTGLIFIARKNYNV